jgi:hypothetical protein
MSGTVKSSRKPRKTFPRLEIPKIRLTILGNDGEIEALTLD